MPYRFIYTGKVTHRSNVVIDWISFLDVASTFKLDDLVIAVGDYLINQQKEWIQHNVYAVYKHALSSNLRSEEHTSELQSH